MAPRRHADCALRRSEFRYQHAGMHHRDSEVTDGQQQTVGGQSPSWIDARHKRHALRQELEAGKARIVRDREWGLTDTGDWNPRLNEVDVQIQKATRQAERSQVGSRIDLSQTQDRDTQTGSCRHGVGRKLNGRTGSGASVRVVGKAETASAIGQLICHLANVSELVVMSPVRYGNGWRRLEVFILLPLHPFLVHRNHVAVVGPGVGRIVGECNLERKPREEGRARSIEVEVEVPPVASLSTWIQPHTRRSYHPRTKHGD